jgi:hypothetical protein
VTHLHWFIFTYIPHYCPQNQPILSVNCGKPDILPKHWHIFHKKSPIFTTCRSGFQIRLQEVSYASHTFLIPVNASYSCFAEIQFLPGVFLVFSYCSIRHPSQILRYSFFYINKTRSGFRIRSQEELYASHGFMFRFNFVLRKSSYITKHVA